HKRAWIIDGLIHNEVIKSNSPISSVEKPAAFRLRVRERETKISEED
ncbi:MAG: hypothetical protein ACI9DF_003330, partial [Verrucomicrobiales bacterium]